MTEAQDLNFYSGTEEYDAINLNLFVSDSKSESSLASSSGHEKVCNTPTLRNDTDIELLKGEGFPHFDKDVIYLSPYSGGTVKGTLAVTNYRLRFTTKNGEISPVEVTLGAISRVDKKGGQRSSGENSYGIDVVCKDMRTLTFAYKQENHSRRVVFEQIQRVAFPLSNKLPLFAYRFEEIYPNDNGWSVYDHKEELKRLGVPNKIWHVTSVNEKYELCETYPCYFAVPKVCSDDLLREVASFRRHGRIPVLSWLHPVSFASITRSAQPGVGFQNKHSEADEEYLEKIMDANPNSHALYIMDARPFVNAQMNKTRGGGYEDKDRYKKARAKLQFLDIKNIHVMRESLRKLRDACFPEIDDSKFLVQLERSGWLNHIRTLIGGATKIADLLERHKTSVFIHCSDGWDRTAQLSCLSMLMLDPYYRTVRGFQVLIEKEWCSFGHKFSLRIGHGEDRADDSERSPVFLQFLDCVWQMTQQFPHAFEFNEHYLITIMDHVYSCKFGTFLCNSEFQRHKEGVFTGTQSLWSEINSDVKPFLNPSYLSQSSCHIILPSPSIRSLRLWKGYYLRWNLRMEVQEPCYAENCLRLIALRDALMQMRRDLQSEKEKAAQSKREIPKSNVLVVPPRPSLAPPISTSAPLASLASVEQTAPNSTDVTV